MSLQQTPARTVSRDGRPWAERSLRAISAHERAALATPSSEAGSHEVWSKQPERTIKVTPGSTGCGSTTRPLLGAGRKAEPDAATCRVPRPRPQYRIPSERTAFSSEIPTPAALMDQEASAGRRQEGEEKMNSQMAREPNPAPGRALTESDLTELVAYLETEGAWARPAGLLPSPWGKGQPPARPPTRSRSLRAILQVCHSRSRATKGPPGDIRRRPADVGIVQWSDRMILSS